MFVAMRRASSQLPLFSLFLTRFVAEIT